MNRFKKKKHKTASLPSWCCSFVQLTEENINDFDVSFVLSLSILYFTRREFPRAFSIAFTNLSESAPIPYLSLFYNALCICAPVYGQSLHLCSESYSPSPTQGHQISLPPPSFPSFCSRSFLLTYKYTILTCIY